MYNTIFLRLYTLQQAHHPKFCFHLSPYSWYHLLISPFPYSFPFGNQHSVLYIYFFFGGVACAVLLLFVYFFILHIWVRSYGICLWIISLSIMPSRHTYVPKGKLYIQWNIYIHLNIYIFHQGRILNPIGSLPFILRKTLSNPELKLISKSS